MNLDYVDLGLPSGTLWAKCNLGAKTETDLGLFYRWGEIKGYSGNVGYNFSWDTYRWNINGDLTKYNKNDGKLILDNEDDPVYVATDGRMKSPTREQLQELIDYTNHDWIENFEGSGVNGMKFVSKSDDTKYIFIPAAGYCDDYSHSDVGSCGYLWSASRSEASTYNVWYMDFSADNVYIYYYYRDGGFTVRGVTVPQTETFDEIDDTDDGQPVDLGLPSGTKWMKSNVGATKPSDFGKFYQWGDIQGYEDASEHQFSLQDYKFWNYDSLIKYNNLDNKLILDNEDDPVFVATNGKFKMPTKEQMRELIDCTVHKWINVDGVNGMKFVNKNDSTKYIFIPAAGSCYDGSYNGVNSWGFVWSASQSNAYTGSAWYIYFNLDDTCMHCNDCYFGFPVRGVLNK